MATIAKSPESEWQHLADQLLEQGWSASLSRFPLPEETQKPSLSVDRAFLNRTTAKHWIRVQFISDSPLSRYYSQTPLGGGSLVFFFWMILAAASWESQGSFSACKVAKPVLERVSAIFNASGNITR